MAKYETPSDTQRNYHAAQLTFEANGDITWFNPVAQETWEVMMGWEQPIMEKMAEVCVNEGDHVLECGFGMGILATAVQARKPASHTICETHPQLQPKLAEFASNNPTVRAVNDRWLSLLDERGRYDVILMDTYADADLHPRFAYFVKRKTKHNGKVSWWNWSGCKTDPWMKFYWPDEHIVFHDVNINPPENQYYNKSVYHLPVYTAQIPSKGFGILSSSVVQLSDGVTDHAGDTISTLPITRVHNESVVSCADPANPTLTDQTPVRGVTMDSRGIYDINNGLLKVTGTHPMIVKRNGVWAEYKMNELVVGDMLYKRDNTEVEITSIDFDDSDDNKYVVSRLLIDHNYFVNDILIKEGGSSA